MARVIQKKEKKREEPFELVICFSFHRPVALLFFPPARLDPLCYKRHLLYPILFKKNKQTNKQNIYFVRNAILSSNTIIMITITLFSNAISFAFYPSSKTSVTKQRGNKTAITKLVNKYSSHFFPVFPGIQYT